ncbi:MAG: hypothetical protein HKM06_02750 [Spirochaetales bacterium]|nr:hypothetical protein [Spirochaetales bacterium]
MTNDSRRFPRYSILAMVRLDYGKEAGVEASTLNYSQNGLLCRTKEPLARGTKLSVLLDVDGSGWKLAVDAVCVREVGLDDGSYEVGLEILEIASEAHQKLLDFFSKKAGEKN